MKYLTITIFHDKHTSKLKLRPVESKLASPYYIYLIRFLAGVDCYVRCSVHSLSHRKKFKTQDKDESSSGPSSLSIQGRTTIGGNVLG